MRMLDAGEDGVKQQLDCSSMMQQLIRFFVFQKSSSDQ